MYKTWSEVRRDEVDSDLEFWRIRQGIRKRREAERKARRKERLTEIAINTASGIGFLGLLYLLVFAAAVFEPLF